MDIMFGLMAGNIKVCGKIIRCMEEESFFGLMEESIKEIILMIKNKAKVTLLGQMVGPIMDRGKMANKMAMELIRIRVAI